MSVSEYVPVRDVARIAETLSQVGSVLVFRAPDGRMAAAADGLVGYGPDREAALRSLARLIALTRAD